LKTKGYADGGFPIALNEKAFSCIQALKALNANLTRIQKNSVYDILSMLPRPTCGELADPLFEILNWYEDLIYREHLNEKLLDRELNFFQGELMGFLQLLEVSPSAAFEIPKRGEQPPAPESEIKKRGRPPDTDPKEDQRIYDSWKASGYTSYEEFERKNGINKIKVKEAVDRERKRRNKSAGK
jgi:hypothetical protein